MANQCYHEGEYWQAVSDTAAGESPTTNPEKWRRIRLPAEWRHVLARLTYATLLEMDGQRDKANDVRREARKGDGGLDDLVRREVNRERHQHRPDVQTRCN